MTVAWVVLMVVGGLVSLAAFVWLLMIAFGESTAWGLACLFIPFAVLIFAVKSWDGVKPQFLGCLAGLILSLFGVVGYSMTSVNVGIEEYVDLGEQVTWKSPTVDPITSVESGSAMRGDPVATEERPEPDEGVEGVDEDMKASAELNIFDDEDDLKSPDEFDEMPPPFRPHRDGKLVPLSSLGLLQGERVVFLLNSLERVSAYVVSVDDETVRLRQRVGGGSVTYTIGLKHVKEARSRKAP